jgi:hypothetical protein
VLPRQATSSQAGVNRAHPWKDNRMAMLADHYDDVVGGDPDRDSNTPRAELIRTVIC